MPRRRLIPLVAIALAVLAAPAVGGADSASHGTQGRSAATLRSENIRIATKARAAVLELYSLDQRLGAARSSLVSLQQQRIELNAERASLTRERALARRSTARAQTRLGIRLRELYEQGGVEPLEVVLGAKSLDEALSSLDSLSRMSSQGQEILSQLHAARRELRSAAAQLARRDAALRAAAAQARLTAAALEQTTAARSHYLSSLAATRRLNNAQITALVASAHAARVRSAHLVARTASSGTSLASFSPAAVARPAQSAAGQALTVSATAYSLPGHTAIGLPVGWGVVAVDPSLIPLGTHMTIPGYGEAIAADTGSAVLGATIDLWFPSLAQANAWGRRTVTIVLH
jgi:3D (Asp-Asp-Asp) domain-containing protein